MLFLERYPEELKQNVINEQLSMPSPKWEVFTVGPQILIVNKRQRGKKAVIQSEEIS